MHELACTIITFVVVVGAYMYYEYKKGTPPAKLQTVHSASELPRQEVEYFDDETGMEQHVVYNQCCSHCANRANYGCAPSNYAYCNEFVGENILEKRL